MPNHVRHKFGSEVRRLRKEARMSLDKLAAATRLSRGYIWKIEKGEANPSLDVMCTISAALGSDPGLLLLGSGEDDATLTRVAELEKERLDIMGALHGLCECLEIVGFNWNLNPADTINRIAKLEASDE